MSVVYTLGFIEAVFTKVKVAVSVVTVVQFPITLRVRIMLTNTTELVFV